MHPTLLETLAAWPDYVAYFNVVAGGPRGGLSLLADSNLDWGQDLELLKQWQEKNRDVPLALAYFGTSEQVMGPQGPTSDWRTIPQLGYGLRFVSAPPNPNDARGHVVAISATYLQGVYTGSVYAAYRSLVPIEVLGGTIYLYDLRNR